MKKLIVFDLDGTLHHTECALAPSIAAATTDITGDEPPSYEDINRLYGEPLELFCEELVGRCDDDTFSKFMDGVKHYQKLYLPSHGKLYPGVERMLEKLSRMGFDLAVLSNAHLDYIELVTETFGIKHFFVNLMGRDRTASKTDRLKSLANSYDTVVMVGDRYHDIQAGLENGFSAIACDYGYGSPSEHTGALIARNVSEVLELISNL